MFYKVKTTECNYEHNCESLEMFYNVTIKSKRGDIKVNIEEMSTLLLILKDIHQGTPLKLRLLMLRYIHHEQPSISQYIANFRQRLALNYVIHPTFESVPMDHAQQLLSPKENSDKEMEVLQNPISRINFNNIYTKVDSADCTFW